MRNLITQFFYTKVLKPIFFRIDPEKVHDRMVATGGWLGRHALTRRFVRAMFFYRHPALTQTLVGLTFPNPVGLSAGFDKNGELTTILPAVGFGFMEIGSVTGEPCEGNPKPRLWRLKKSKALAVYYGLKNDGAAVVAARLKNKKKAIPLGISVAKTNCVATADTNIGIADYVAAFRGFVDIADYYTLNISCPNAYGGQPFTDAEQLGKLLTAIEAVGTRQPVFLKLSPDLNQSELDAIIAVANQHQIAGFVCSNLTKNRDNPRIFDANVPEHGGISGAVMAELSDQLIASVYQKTKGRYVIIGVGGIASAKDAYRKIKAGASLVQIITGMIYEGPQLISQINADLVRLLWADGYENISEAVGTAHKT